MNLSATLAALCIFNGLKISPVLASPSHRFALPCGPISPRFTQAERYLSQAFPKDTGPDKAALIADAVARFAPLEVFNGAMAAAPWIRGAIGTLQWSFREAHGIAIPNAEDIDPASWFEDLEGLVILYGECAFPNPTEEQARDIRLLRKLANKVMDRWDEEEGTADPESNQGYIQKLYAIANAMQERDQLLTSVTRISNARKNKPLEPGQKYPF